MADRDQHPSREDEIRHAVFGQVDLQTAELEIVSSIYDGFAAAIVVKGQPRTIALTREYGDAVQLMALIERGHSTPSSSEAGSAAGEGPQPVRGEIRVIDGNRCRFIERELEGDKWEIIGPAAASDPEPMRWVSRVMEVREECDGFWAPCSGCQESVDGYVSTKDYPYSAAFACQPGGGCSECGGLGVKWDTTDYDAMATSMLADMAAEEAGEIDLYDDSVQAGIAWTMRQWGETLGLTRWDQGDGSESVEGDVGAEIHTILVDAGLRDPETNETAALRAPQPVACRFCDGAGWEDDQNWEPRYSDVPQEREKGDGLIRCGHCLGDGVDPSPAAHPAPDALRAAVEALEPFAKGGHHRTMPGLSPSYTVADFGDGVVVTVADFRRAAEAFAALQAEQGAK